jgi:hypothetical protein
MECGIGGGGEKWTFPGYWPVFIEFAQANLDARTQPYQVLQHRIMEIQKYTPEMMDYMRREAHVI